jgi:serine/threonine protein kinase
MPICSFAGNVGTVHWSAPEVLSNQRYQFPADVYGLGMVLYEMAYGRVPFQDMMPLAVMMAVAIQRQQPDLPTLANPKIVEIIKRYTCCLT